MCTIHSSKIAKLHTWHVVSNALTTFKSFICDALFNAIRGGIIFEICQFLFSLKVAIPFILRINILKI